MFIEKEERMQRVKLSTGWRALALMLEKAGVGIYLCGALASAQGSELVFEAPRLAEGDEGSIEYEIEIALDEVSRQPLRVDFITQPGTASENEDFIGSQGSLVFVPGSLKPGLPRPETAEDSLMRGLVLEDGFGIDVLAELDDPVGLAFPPPDSVFGEFLYVGSLNQNGIGVRDSIVRINSLGDIEDFVLLLPEADPTSLEFSSLSSQYGDFLYVSANNRDGSRPGDQGGTVQRVDSKGEVVDFTSVGIPFGPGEPGELAFGIGTEFGDLLYLANSVGSPGDILGVLPDGALTVVVDDGLLEESDVGLAPRSLAIDPGDNYGGLAYFGEFGRRCSCLKKLYPDGQVEAWVTSLPGDPHAIAFAPDGPFGGKMYVALDNGVSGSIARVWPDGELELLISGLQGFLNGNGKDVMEFSSDGSVLYVADFYADRIYRIAPAGKLSVKIVGDLRAEPDETVRIEFIDPINVERPHDIMWVTIEDNDLGDSPPELQFESEIIVTEDSGAHAFFMGLIDDQTSVDQLTIELELQDGELMWIRDVRKDAANGGVWIELETRVDQFGLSQLQVRVVDSGGNQVIETLPVRVTPVNDPPTLSPIRDHLVTQDQGVFEVHLEGIGSGAENEADPLSLRVSVQGEAPIPTVTASYESPGETGSLLFSIEQPGLVAGREFWVEVMVDDKGEEANEIRQSFRLVFEDPPTIDPVVDLPPTVRIQSPEPYQIIAPDLDFQPPLARVPIRLEAADDRRVERIEILANGRLIGAVRGADREFIWEDVPVGDYRLVAVAYDAANQSFESEKIDVAVASSAGSIAIVRNHDSQELGILTEYLYDIGFNTDLFWSSRLDVGLLEPYDLIIWHQSDSGETGLGNGNIDALVGLFDSGMPFYFIGRGSEGVDDISWSMFSGFQRHQTEMESVPTFFSDEAIEEIKNGRYGALGQAGFEFTSDNEVLRPLGSFVIAEAGDRPLMVAFPGADVSSGEGARRITQVFSVLGPHSKGMEDRFRSLFQNSVCWLLRCDPCSALDLELVDVTESGGLEVNGQVRYSVRVKHSGECEATAVSLDVRLPENVRIVQAVTSRGFVERPPSGLRFDLGRMTSASEAILEWTVAFPVSGRFAVTANLQSNSIEGTDVNNRLEWQTVLDVVPVRILPELRVRASSSEGLEISIVGEGGPLGTEFEVQRSRDLKSWVTWRFLSVGRWVSLKRSPNEGGEYYRLALEE